MAKACASHRKSLCQSPEKLLSATVKARVSFAIARISLTGEDLRSAADTVILSADKENGVVDRSLAEEWRASGTLCPKVDAYWRRISYRGQAHCDVCLCLRHVWRVGAERCQR
jgi:hypothetical protein